MIYHRRRYFPSNDFFFQPHRPAKIIVFLPGSGSYQLHRFCNRISSVFIVNQKVDMIRSDHIVENAQFETFFCLKKPIHPSSSIACKLQEKFFFVASMGNMPDISGYVMPICTRHRDISLNGPFWASNGVFKTEKRLIIHWLFCNFSGLAWYDPGL
jgi:hypothetical protein